MPSYELERASKPFHHLCRDPPESRIASCSTSAEFFVYELH
jgi:hypothetical protein